MPQTDSDKFSDEQLAETSIKNPEIYAILVERYRNYLLNFIYFNFIRNKEQAEDMLQETFLKAYLNLAKFNPEKKWKTWIFKIAVNTCYSFLRRPFTENLEDYIDILEADSSPEIFTEQELQKDKLKKALNALDPDYRLIIDLFYKKDLTYREISNLLNIQINTVKARLHRARQQLVLSFRYATF
jgi:RNA polymerase sigma-70 factor (ECF subfamily)